MDPEVWILGGTGRSARATAVELLARGITPTLVGRDPDRLTWAADRLAAESASPDPAGRGPAGSGPAGRCRTVLAGTPAATAAAIRERRPAVVINTIGPFADTAAPLIAACLAAGSHYVDLANDVAAVAVVLGRADAAVAAGRTLVTGAGFGVTATESVVVKLCADRPAPLDVRVDMIPSLATEAGRLGDALAGTLVEGLPGVEGGGRFQGRRYRAGRLAPAPLAGEPLELTLPDGTRVTTASMPLGELVAAQRASGAPAVLAASAEAPSAPLIRAMLPLVTGLLRISAVRAFARRRLAAVEFKAKPRPREHSWGHARIRWSDGTVREGWLRVGEAQAFTGAVPAEVTRRLLAGEGRPGAHFPAALFGPSLAESCGGTYLLDAHAV
ncbi:saccharopine dehydrogenase NADP-binding domain-containing protein [Paractinoplanes ferrugineus]|uniref:Membrane protein n=1 Tax=Paractinoplanes ferrugineus TaxID=113564 RepID=A0A919M8I9_9ACTN|nr:saccharopine dehydrogenase NADP-binding domain-containing protein [Actinoplanes ferrugineus]GIE10516.1 membrane protein [Actinoplanes ferrugineus]